MGLGQNFTPTITKHKTENLPPYALGCKRKCQTNNLVLYVDQELVEKSRELGFNLSKIFENHLKHLINRFSTVNSVNNFNLTHKNSKWWAGPDLNPNGVSARYVPEFGARELKRKIQTEIETPLAREILSGSIAAGDVVRVDFDKSSGKVTFVKQ